MPRLAQACAARQTEETTARLAIRVLEGVERFSNGVLDRLQYLYSRPQLDAPRECVGCSALNPKPPMVLRWMCRCGTINESSYHFYQRVLDVVERELLQRGRVAS